MPAAPVLLLAASALHLGFQAVVTLLVYPALLRVPAGRWDAEHAAHRRAVTPVVAVVYGLLAAACAAVLLAGPRTPLLLVPVAAAALAAAATAAVAAPTHGRLAADGPSPVLAARLRRADAVRLAAALVGAGAALAGVLV